MANAAPTSTNKAVSPQSGIDFNQTYTVSSSTPEYPAPPFPLGMHALGDNETEYVFTQAGEAIAQYALVGIVPTTYKVNHMTVARNRALQQPALAQVAIASGDYGWVAIRGRNLGALGRLSSLANVPCYVSSVSAGRLSTTSIRLTSGGAVFGVILTTSITSTSTPQNAVVVDAGEGMTNNRIGG